MKIAEVASWLVYAVVWIVPVMLAVGLILEPFFLVSNVEYRPMTCAWEHGYPNQIISPILQGPGGDIPFWYVPAFWTTTLGAWLVILWKRPAIRWALVSFALCIVAIAVACLPTSLPIILIIPAIAIGRFIVQSVGRRSVFSRSVLKIERVQVSPRSMIE